ncbi:MAG TPA: YbhB/YbcL family Raf kinase inhibitor-like protein [Kofleriaceae bacterium]
MLEKLPFVLGRVLRRVRPGLSRIVSARDGIRTAPTTIELASSAFRAGEAMPARYTADFGGEYFSPPLAWSNVPEGALTLALIVEDADSPTPYPLVHAIAAGLPATAGGIEEGDLVWHESHLALGRNSFLKLGWMPPDPPPGHGVHRYVFQLFALDYVPELSSPLGRSAIAHAVRNHTLARGVLIGTYRR